MQTVAGTFATRAEAMRAVDQLEDCGIRHDRITLLTPGEHVERRVPMDEGEQPGTGKALGAVVGGATGAAMGVPIGAAISLMIPGVGPVIASGIIGALLFGAGGAAVGGALEESLVNGLPRDEAFVYEDALRRGRSVVVALAEDDAHVECARNALAAVGAESIDAARERWWLGLRSAEQETYAGGAAAFRRDEAAFRRGFEAAMASSEPWRIWDEAHAGLRAQYGAEADSPAFRVGWERGVAYRRAAATRSELPKSA